jgi:signal transduction histidine kinase
MARAGPHTVRRAVPSHRRPTPLGIRPRDWRVRTKLASVLMLPLIGFLVLAGVQMVSSIRSSLALRSVAAQVALGRQVTALVHELQRERDHTVGLLAAVAPPAGPDPQRNVADLSPDWTAVDRAADALSVAVAPLADAPAVATRYASAASSLAHLAQVRAGVQSGWLRERAVFDQYTHTIADLLALLPNPTTVGGDARLGQVVRALVNVSIAKELSAQIRGHLYAVCSAGQFSFSDFAQVADARAQRQAAIDRFRADADPASVTRYDDVVTGQAVQNASRLEQAVVDHAAAADLGVDPQQWWQASTTQLELMRGAEQQLLDAAISGTAARSAAASQTTVVATTGTALLLLVAVLTSLVIGASMGNNLNLLRDHALEVAHRRLPQVLEALRTAPAEAPAAYAEPIPIATADEIGEVAQAFTAVHRSAVRLATEQAHMRRNVDAIFVNLARRSQTLVERQLQLLDALERAEVDPDQLDSLFHLDHLATRLRRNDENLLVLAGGETTRRWSEPVTLVSVVLAAAAEIEHYPRIRHDISDGIAVVGHAVADLVHLVAELLENATVFSPPDADVGAVGWADHNGGAQIMISDQGIGMSAAAMARANQELTTPPTIDASSAERMGLVVVARLAHRHGIRVELRSSGRGLVAAVGIPAALIAPASTFSPAVGAGAGGGTGAYPPVRSHPPGARADVGEEPRRLTPTRAEDIIGGGRASTASVWWSRRAAASRPVAALPMTAHPVYEPDVSSAGLPVRVPMAQLREGGPGGAHPATVQDGNGAQPYVPDPIQVGGVLTRFYGGVHRAVAEDDSPPHDATTRSPE